MEHYNEALRLNPDLAEAHNTLDNHYVRLGKYEDALRHLDQVIFSDQKQGRTSAVSGWRANVLFNLGDRAAFREINGLIVHADRLGWIWPWCRRLVAGFGRASADNARQAAPFWQRYVEANPKKPASRWELLKDAGGGSCRAAKTARSFFLETIMRTKRQSILWR